jgi:tetratricopeptide (TPR) repeat protein
LVRSLAAAALFVIAHAAVPPRAPGAWSLDAGVGVPASLQLAALLLAAGAAYAALRASAALDPWRGRRERAVAAAALAGLALLAAVAFPSATALLGDGQLRLNDLARAAGPGVPDMSAGDDTAPLAFAVTGAVHALLGGGDPATAYRVVAAAAGALYAALALAAAGSLAPSARTRGVVLVALLTVGAVPQFLGYVEMYALLLPGGLAFLLAASADREAGRAPWRSAAVLAVLAALHFSSLALLPVLAYAAGGRLRAGAAACAGAAAGTVAIVASLGYPLAGAEALGAKILPLAAAGGAHRHAYGALSPAHLLDVLQEIVLVAPVAVMAPLVGPLRAGWGSPARAAAGRGAAGTDAAGGLLVVAAASQLLFLLFANPEIGAFRDWDLLAAATLPLTLLGARRLARAEAGAPAARSGKVGGAAGFAVGAAFPVLAAAAAHTLLWVTLNASEPRSDARFERLMTHARIAPRGEAYGWETLARWRLDRGRPDDAARAAVRATEAAPDNGRLWLNAANVLQSVGALEEARRAFERAAEIRPEFAPGRFQLAQLLRFLGDEPAARIHAEAALALEPEGALAEDVRRWLGSE